MKKEFKELKIRKLRLIRTCKWMVEWMKQQAKVEFNLTIIDDQVHLEADPKDIEKVINLLQQCIGKQDQWENFKANSPDMKEIEEIVLAPETVAAIETFKQKTAPDEQPQYTLILPTLEGIIENGTSQKKRKGEALEDNFEQCLQKIHNNLNRLLYDQTCTVTLKDDLAPLNNLFENFEAQVGTTAGTKNLLHKVSCEVNNLIQKSEHKETVVVGNLYAKFLPKEMETDKKIDTAVGLTCARSTKY